MNKIAIIGCGGAGKSSLSISLGNSLSLPVHHLDCMFWNPDWIPGDRDEFIKKQEIIFARDRWIMDGNYGNTMDIRLENADTIIFLDLPSIVCLWGVIKRYFKFRNKTRPDMTEGNNERITFEFLNYVWTYRRHRQPLVMKKLKALSQSKKIIILKTRREIKAFQNKTANSQISMTKLN